MSIRQYNTKLSYKPNTHVSIATNGQFSITMDPLHHPEQGVQGMTPIESFISSICGCELAVIAGYQKIKKMDIKDVKIDVKAERETNPTDGYYGLTSMEINYYFDSTNTEQELENFIKFVHDACPLHATISRAVPIKSVIHKI
ncbi:OsmC family protein [Malacoplasma iowae]|uniref:OsmC family protein n=1 Tax=Malacoplasma iowae TaxID=2116 RepID=UPI0038737BB8|nr:OsmC family protein [Malacoplasma iowae]